MADHVGGEDFVWLLYNFAIPYLKQLFFCCFSGYLYGHVSYLADDCEACLLLLSVDREQFFTLSEAKQKIVDVSM